MRLPAWLLRPRTIFLGTFVACAALLGYGLYMQHVLRLEPCPLCILQRYAFVATGVVALVAGLHNPGRSGRWVYSLLIVLASGAGAAAAGRQSWLQHNPPKIADCGPDLAYMVDVLGLSQALPMIFKGEGDCAKVVWRFLGLSIPEWALVWFAAFIAAALVAALARPKVSIFRGLR